MQVRWHALVLCFIRRSTCGLPCCVRHGFLYACASHLALWLRWRTGDMISIETCSALKMKEHSAIKLLCIINIYHGQCRNCQTQRDYRPGKKKEGESVGVMLSPSLTYTVHLLSLRCSFLKRIAFISCVMVWLWNPSLWEKCTSITLM